MWILFAFSGPVFWAISTHVDKYLVDRYFKNSDTAVLLTIFLPGFGREDLSRTNLLQKGIAAVLVAIGVILINT